MAKFHVAEIHCDGCIRAMTSAVQALDHTARLQADLVSKLVTVASTLNDQEVAEAIRDAGFSAHPVA